MLRLSIVAADSGKPVPNVPIDYRVREGNKFARKELAEIGSMHPLDFISGRDRPAMETAMRRVLEAGEETALEAELVDRTGNVRPYAITGKAVRLGGRMYMLGLGADITMKRRAEQQMARAKERLDLAQLREEM